MKQRTTFSPGVRNRQRGAYRRSTATGVVYFITCKWGDFPIKIGFATVLEPRIRSVQTSLPYDVYILYTTPGNRDREREIGNRFAHLRLRGEWYRRDPAIYDYIAKLKIEDEAATAVGFSFEDWDMPSGRQRASEV